MHTNTCTSYCSKSSLQPTLFLTALNGETMNIRFVAPRMEKTRGLAGSGGGTWAGG